MKGSCLQFGPHSRVRTRRDHFRMISNLSVLNPRHSWSLSRSPNLCVCLVCVRGIQIKPQAKLFFLQGNHAVVAAAVAVVMETLMLY